LLNKRDSWRSSGPQSVEYERNQLHDEITSSSTVTAARLSADRD
jgi:hypothetical protein